LITEDRQKRHISLLKFLTIRKQSVTYKNKDIFDEEYITSTFTSTSVAVSSPITSKDEKKLCQQILRTYQTYELEKAFLNWILLLKNGKVQFFNYKYTTIIAQIRYQQKLSKTHVQGPFEPILIF
jgi:hypothetical protein